jgi:hypothetical protein
MQQQRGGHQTDVSNANNQKVSSKVETTTYGGDEFENDVDTVNNNNDI